VWENLDFDNVIAHGSYYQCWAINCWRWRGGVSCNNDTHF